MRGRLFGLSVFALGIVYLLLAWSLPLQTLSGPGPGVFPLAVAAGLLLTGAMAALRPESPVTIQVPTRGSTRSVIVVFASLVALCLLFQGFGYSLSGVLLMTAVLRAFKASWAYALSVSIVSVFGTYVIFVTVLGLTLPRGAWVPW
jgi:putative tricarboxylic transport membrane protein